MPPFSSRQSLVSQESQGILFGGILTLPVFVATLSTNLTSVHCCTGVES